MLTNPHSMLAISRLTIGLLLIGSMPVFAAFQPAAPFSMADLETGSTRFTNSNLVELVELPIPEGYDHYQITDDGDPNALGAWVFTNAIPGTIEFAQPATDIEITYYAWFTNTSASVELQRSEGSIVYTETAPDIVPRETFTRETAGFSVRIRGRDIDGGSTGGTAVGEPMGMHAIKPIWIDGPFADATPEADAYLTLTNTGVYSVALYVVNEAGNAATSAVTCAVSIVHTDDLPEGTRFVAEGNLFASPPYDTWTNAAATIQAAVDAIDAQTESIWIAPGIYTSTANPVVDIRQGSLDVETLRIRGLGGPESVVVDAENARRGMYVEASTHADWLVEGLTVMNGLDSSRGGGIYLRGVSGASGTVTLENLVVTGCRVTGQGPHRGGAGIYVYGSGQPDFLARLIGCTLSNNTLPGRHGGAGLYLRDTLSLVEDCKILDNVMTESRTHHGGGIYIAGSVAGSIVRDTLIAGNVGGRGGGVGLRSGWMTFENCILRDNEATQFGGGIFEDSHEPPLLRNVLVHGNVASSRAGGIASMQGGVVVESSTIVSNYHAGTSTYAGGILIEDNDPGTAIIRNSILHENYRAGNEVNLVLRSGGQAEIRHSCITAYSVPPNAGNLDASPQLVDIEGGNFRLASGSPCINAGEYQVWMDDAVDLDGKPRIDPIHNQVDMGAFEYQVPATIILIR